MEACIQTGRAVPQWYLVIDRDTILAGAGVIENDFHDRKELCPNLCALYVEAECRGRGMAGRLLQFICRDCSDRGIETLYLMTDHTGFYERYGWEFCGMARGEGDLKQSRMYRHQTAAANPIPLTPRLAAVAALVPQGARLADVGTDHAYLPAYLLQTYQIRRAVVSDLRSGPLSRARATAARYGLTDRMEFRLCDGLSGLRPEEADTIAIAGMGGETIAAILAAAPWTAQGAHRLLLQPMSAQNVLRPWLQSHGYAILRERLACEGNSLYTILQAAPGSMEPLTPAQCWAGRQGRGEASPLRGEYLNRLIVRLSRALEGLGASTRPADVPRRLELEEARLGLIEMLEEWNTWQL